MSKYQIITEVRGMGLLIGMEMNKEISGDIVSKSLEKGLLINAVRPNMIRFMPPLNVSKQEVDTAINIIESILKDF
jgi:acetylornithine/succinyldiaminopimelate/putrescine aminotransferase